MIEVAVSAAKEAGKFILDNFGKVTKIESKGDRNLATDIDKKAEEIITRRIAAEFPGHGILGEEETKKQLSSDYLWIIDPLDGTHNYIRGLNIFGVSIGLVHKQEFILGVVYMPWDDELYTGQKDKGAYKNGKRIFVSSEDTLKRASISFDSSIRYSPEIMLGTLGKLSKEVFNVRMFGSSVRTLTYVAEGKLDLSLEFHDRPWDFAGSVAIIKEAGGVFLDLNYRPVSPKTIGYIASGKKIFPAIKNLLGEIY